MRISQQLIEPQSEFQSCNVSRQKSRVKELSLSSTPSQQVFLCPEQDHSSCFILTEVFDELQLPSLSGCQVG